MPIKRPPMRHVGPKVPPAVSEKITRLYWERKKRRGGASNTRYARVCLEHGVYVYGEGQNGELRFAALKGRTLKRFQKSVEPEPGFGGW